MKNLRLACICVLCASPTMLHAQNGIQIISQSYNISASWYEDLKWDPPQGGASPYWGQPYPGDWSAGYQLTPDNGLPPGYIITGGYSLSSSDGTPVAASTAAPCPPGLSWQGGSSPLTASASIGLFSVQNNATAYDNDAPGFTPPLGGTVHFKGSVQTSVQAVWLLSPIGNSLEVNINASDFDIYGSQWAGLTVTLSDLTDSTTLLNIWNPSPYFAGSGPGPWDNTFAVDLTPKNWT